jgi:hypothetical protein
LAPASQVLPPPSSRENRDGVVTLAVGEGDNCSEQCHRSGNVKNHREESNNWPNVIDAHGVSRNPFRSVGPVTRIRFLLSISAHDSSLIAGNSLLDADFAFSESLKVVPRFTKGSCSGLTRHDWHQKSLGIV